MDIYDFITSKTIAEHCRAIGYKFTPLEMAAVIEWSRKPLEQKFAAWESIITEFPGAIMNEKEHSEPLYLSEYFHELIIHFKKLIESYELQSPEYIYYPNVEYRLGSEPYSKIEERSELGCFTSAELALSAAKAARRYNSLYTEELLCVKLVKFRVNYGKLYTAYYNSDGELYDIDIDYTPDPEEEYFKNFPYDHDEGEESEQVEEASEIYADEFHLVPLYNFMLPVPFHKGDLLVLNGKIWVLSNVPNCNVCDVLSLDGAGYTVCGEENIFWSGVLSLYHAERFYGELPEDYRLLKAISETEHHDR